MKYKEFTPGRPFERFVKCYYVLESENALPVVDKAFATGCIELMFNLGACGWQVGEEAKLIKSSSVELWGQVIQPLPFRSQGAYRMFGMRLHPHTASILLDDEINQFNNQVCDLIEILGNNIRILQDQLLEVRAPEQMIFLVESYLLQRLRFIEKRLDKICLIEKIINELREKDFFDNINNVAARYGISSRYLQTLFLRYTGLSPKLYSKIIRFQNSLVCITENKISLTEIAYECGYYDQSHFIREFKSFTGLVPSEFKASESSAILASPNK